ncbi:ABC transporter ATP-binding protein [Nocardia sp. NPDC046763]|uniref:ABC transporter ATP-binding protein n=1 Tax=Nocardia sp. NPDC046763 TaxID=3155256 RepID=UPI0033EFD772
MSESLLEISDLRVDFGAVTAVDGVDVTVAPGERVALVGASGSGKSSLAHAIIGLLPGSGRVRDGSIRWRGTDITRADEKQMRGIRGKEIGLVPQDPMSNLNPVSRVGRQVSETLVAHGLCSGRAASDRAIELLGEAGLSEPARRARQYPHELSGGQRQRALIAIGLSCRPGLLIADEPTSALDVTVQRRILDHLEELTKELGTALLLVTHDLALAAERADRVLVMSEGRIVESGPAREVLTDPQEDYTRRLVAAAPARLTVLPPTEETTDSESAVTEEPPILEVSQLTKEFRIRGRREVVRAVDNISFTVGRGRTTAIVGESGSGKTTTSRMVLGLLPATSGIVRFDGEEVATLRGARLRAARRAMQPVFQDPYSSLDPMWTVERLITEPLRAFATGDRTTHRARVTELLDQVALPASLAHRYPHELSGGQRQRVAIARALAVEPRLMICDEPVSALDVLVQNQILTLLATLQSELNLSYLFITHDLAVVRALAHDVVVMRNGRILEQGPTDRILNSPNDPYTRDLLAAIPGATAPQPAEATEDTEATEATEDTEDSESSTLPELSDQPH